MTDQNGQQITVAERPQRQVSVVDDFIPVLDTARFDHMWRIATAIGKQSLLPKHLKSNVPEETAANCFRVVNQAVRWGFDPFAMVDETYAVGGKLGYQGKLVAAVVNAKAGLQSRLRYVYNDKAGDDLEVRVIGRLKGEDEDREVKVRVGDAKTSNDMWKKDPRQKLIYTGAIKWARAHTPELILGVMTDDDIDRMRDMGELRPSGDGTYAAGGPPPRPVRSYGTEPTRQALPQQVVDHEEPEIIDQEIDGDATEADTPGPRFWLHDEEGGQMTEYPGADWPGAFARYIDENEVPADVGLAFAKANEAVLREVEKAGFDCSGVRACIEAMEKYQRAQEARRQKAEQEQGQTAGGAGAAQEQEQTANAPATAQADGQPPADAKEGETAAQQPAQAQQQPIPAEGREIRDAAGNIVDRSGRVIEWLGKVQKLVIAAPDGAAKAKIVENNRAIGEHLVKAYPSKAAGPWQTIEADAGVGS